MEKDKPTLQKVPAEQNPHSGHRQRLRQTYIESGPAAMHDHQLLELLLTYAIPRRDTNPIAHELLKKKNFGSLGNLFNADIKDIAKVQGIGESGAVLLSLCGAIAKRAEANEIRGIKLNTPDAAMRFCLQLDMGSKNESMYAVSLDRAGRVLHTDTVSSGIPGETMVYPRTVVECALRHGAEKIILCHNHPSGSLEPSREDYDATRRIMQALSPIGITLSDHIIVGGGKARSMAREAEIMRSEAAENYAAAAERKD